MDQNKPKILFTIVSVNKFNKFCCSEKKLQQFSERVLLSEKAFAAVDCDACAERNENHHRKKPFLPQNYSSLSPSLNGCNNHSHTTISVIWNLKIRGILILSAKHMDFTVDAEVEVYWMDNLLQNLKIDKGLMILPNDISDKMFAPIFEFTNCNACNREIIDPRTSALRIANWKQTVLTAFSFRQKISFNCLFDLSRYPFDSLYTAVWIGHVNVTYDDDLIFYKNFDAKKMTMPSEFQLKQIEILETRCDVIEKANYKPLKRFCFSYKFTFKRTILQNVLIIFLPSSLIVMLSWISFWLDVELAAPRVALGQTSLLTLAAQFNSMQNNLPPISSVKAIDIWMFMCIFMAFASIVEYAVAFNYKKQNPQPQQRNNTHIKVYNRQVMKQLYDENNKRNEILYNNCVRDETRASAIVNPVQHREISRHITPNLAKKQNKPCNGIFDQHKKSFINPDPDPIHHIYIGS
uniref:Neurotransmitter-gated ion-channel transmembrane domain-containing protein n=1 Tax=Strigamia maritima TaxID=126957 RepID=T1JD86_STRMM